MLAEIDKDARDIAALQHENKMLKSELQELKKTVVVEFDHSKKELELMKGEMLPLQEFMAKWKALDSAPILLNAETMEEVVLEPFDEIKGRRLYHAPLNEDPKTRYVAGRNLRVINVRTSCGSKALNTLGDHYHYKCCMSYEDGIWKGCGHDIAIESYFKQKYADMGIVAIGIKVNKDTCTTSTPVNYCSLNSNERISYFFSTSNIYIHDHKKRIDFTVCLIEVL